MRHPSRREFLKSSATAACAAGIGGGALANSLTADSSSAAPIIPPTLSIKKGVWFEMLPAKLSIADRFKMARDAGFEVVQAPTEPDEHKAEEIKKAAEAASIRIDSVMNMDHWKYPLSSSDPAVVDRSLGVCAPELGVVEGGAHAGETSVHDRGIARRERILPVVHVHHRVDSNGSSVGSFFDFFSDLLVRGSGGLDDLEANLARHLEAIGVAEFVG